MRPPPPPRRREIHVHIAGLLGGDNVAHMVGPISIIFETTAGAVLAIARYDSRPIRALLGPDFAAQDDRFSIWSPTTFEILQPPGSTLQIRVPRAGVIHQIAQHPDAAVFGIFWPLPPPPPRARWDASPATVAQRFRWARRRWRRPVRAERWLAYRAAAIVRWLINLLTMALSEPALGALWRFRLTIILADLALAIALPLVGAALLLLGQLVLLLHAGRLVGWSIETIWRCRHRNPYRPWLRRLAIFVVRGVWALALLLGWAACDVIVAGQ